MQIQTIFIISIKILKENSHKILYTSKQTDNIRCNRNGWVYVDEHPRLHLHKQAPPTSQISNQMHHNSPADWLGFECHFEGL